MAEKRRLGNIALTLLEWLGVIVFAIILIALLVIGVVLAWVGDPPPAMGHDHERAASGERAPPLVASREVPTPTADESASLFAPVYDVLVSPRCMNCHPNGDRPLSDHSGVHPQNISRESAESGLACSTCHSDHNTELPGSPLGPPGAPHWQLPPAETPMIFQDRTVTELCLQLRDPAHNGERDLADLLHHVSEDPLVLWGWSPGGERATPKVSHAAFVASFKAWVDAGGICPGEQVAPDLSPQPEEGAEPGGDKATDSATDKAADKAADKATDSAADKAADGEPE